MKNNKKDSETSERCTESRCRMYTGDNDELVFRKTYIGDWGSWDDMPKPVPQEPMKQNDKKEKSEEEL